MLGQVPNFCVYRKLSLRSLYTGRDTLSREMPVQQGQATAQHAVYNKIIHTGTSINKQVYGTCNLFLTYFLATVPQDLIRNINK